MKLRQLTVQGFRGFNEAQTVFLNEKLTLIYAPNSYGKTSISEALEWLLYKITSRVERADYSKDEYKDCYRNRHFPETGAPYVEAIISHDGKDFLCRAELSADNTAILYLDGKGIEYWPFLKGYAAAQKPFILQHALKNLLLATPDERFQGFAALLGLKDLDKLQSDFTSFCTKPEVHLPPEAVSLCRTAEATLGRANAQTGLTQITKAFKKGLPGLKDAFAEIRRECRDRVPAGTTEDAILPSLLKIREDATAKLFSGKVSVEVFEEKELAAFVTADKLLVTTIVNTFTKDYLSLAGLKTVSNIQEKAKFFDIGSQLLQSSAETCPFCGQRIDASRRRYIEAEKTRALADGHACSDLLSKRDVVLKTLRAVKANAADHLERHIAKCSSVLWAEQNLPKLREIFGTKHVAHYEAVASALPKIKAVRSQATCAHETVRAAIRATEETIEQGTHDLRTVEEVGKALVTLAAACREMRSLLTSVSPALRDAQLVLQHELDVLAGTEDVAVLIDLIEKPHIIEKHFRIRSMLDSTKDLRKLVDQTIAQIVLDAISSELTADVMSWYEQIRTTGDPDVHFSGFDMERTAAGTLKARRVRVNAQSYGKDLASAVSSLSESKLNALGLCVSIAANLKGQSPYEFLVIDDPIQSWDAEHETQFISVLRNLIERGKQIVLLSHNQRWLEQVRAGLRSVNGWYYEITGYDAKGPHMIQIPWAKIDERLKEVDAITKDISANSIRIQQGEEEIRILVCEVAAEICQKVKAERKDPNNLNADKVRKMLTECGVDVGLIDRIHKTFSTTDDSHHAAPAYAPNRERLRQYQGYVNELLLVLKRHNESSGPEKTPLKNTPSAQ